MWNLRNTMNEQLENKREKGKPRSRLVTAENILTVATGAVWGGRTGETGDGH